MGKQSHLIGAPISPHSPEYIDEHQSWILRNPISCPHTLRRAFGHSVLDTIGIEKNPFQTTSITIFRLAIPCPVHSCFAAGPDTMTSPVYMAKGQQKPKSKGRHHTSRQHSFKLPSFLFGHAC
nr:hypothetical protein CFP56_32182 [Quercus suber]